MYDGKEEEEAEIVDIPAEFQEEVQNRRTMMLEAIAEFDDELMEKSLKVKKLVKS